MGTSALTRRDVQTLAGLAQADPETTAVIREAVPSPDAPAALQTIARAARCGICHRLLSDPASISRGIGPVCAGHEARGAGVVTPVNGHLPGPAAEAPTALKQRDASAHASRRSKDIAAVLDTLDTLAARYGRDVVMREVVDVFLLQGPATRAATIPLSEQEAQLLRHVALAEGGLTADEAGAVIGENRLIAGKVLATLITLRLVTKVDRRYILREKASL